jgi:hypothetical protein
MRPLCIKMVIYTTFLLESGLKPRKSLGAILVYPFLFAYFKFQSILIFPLPASDFISTILLFSLSQFIPRKIYYKKKQLFFSTVGQWENEALRIHFYLHTASHILWLIRQNPQPWRLSYYGSGNIDWLKCDVLSIRLLPFNRGFQCHRQ